jgi:general secretion pathway protein D
MTAQSSRSLSQPSKESRDVASTDRYGGLFVVRLRAAITVLKGTGFGCRAYFLLLSISLFFLAGCSVAPVPSAAEDRPEASSAHDLRISRVLADEGLKKLSERRYEDASRIFNAGLKFSPSDARLHFLNGLAYHLLYLRGNEATKDLGVAGYELALNYDPALYHAALQLGRLEFAAKRYRESADAFRRAVAIQPKSGDGYLGLASAAYYAQDLELARTTAEKAASLLPKDVEATRALAMIYAALGEQTKAGEASARYAVLEQNAGARAGLSARVDQWSSWHEAAPGFKGEPYTGTAGAPIAQLSSPPAGDGAPTLPGSKPGDTPIPPGTQPERPGSGSGVQGRGDSPGPGAPAEGPPAPGPNPRQQTGTEQAALRPWFDCGGSSADQGQSQGGSSGGADEIAPMPRLPSPCPSAGNPRMVVLDIAFVRTEDNATSSHGINLLDGLTYVLGMSRTVSDVLTTGTPGVADSRTITITHARNSGIGSASGLLYSLNIANSTDNRTEVLAKPSLVALDRMPSTFFSGRNVTLAIQGAAGSASSITDRPIGVSLSVTPTFIDAETVLLAVRAQRSFIEAVDSNVVFGASLQTSRNTVSANVALKMGQSLILSGLAEQEVQRVSNGVPVLKDIPLLQYLFNTKTTLNFTKSVLVLITPRPPTSDQEVMSKTMENIDTLNNRDNRKLRPLIEKAMKEKPGSIPDHIEATYWHTFGNTLFLQFRTGDLTIEHWSAPPRLEEFFRELGQMLYF